MSDMTPEKATALRKPFPPESVGKLPKGPVMLDYVGHAAVTDRLLTVDPHWSWEPFAIGPDGLPALDRSNNLWIKLTICGVTRIGVGDGKSLKECIGDAIRNAAMRFGVALDLWAKENLVEFAQAANRPQQQDIPRQERQEEPPPPAEHVASGPDDKPMTARTRGRLFALFTDRGIEDRDEQLRGINHLIERELTSRSELTEAEAKVVIAALERKSAREETPA